MTHTQPGTAPSHRRLPHQPRSRRLLLLALLLGALTFAQACGPDFFPDTFVRTWRPDLPQRYAAGHLGILQTGFPAADLFVAFRYLNGGTLSPVEQKGWSPMASLAEQDYGGKDTPPAENDAAEPRAALQVWQELRAQYAGAPPEPDPNAQQQITTAQGFVYRDTFLNCTADAFRTATRTLQARSATWGKTSAPLRNWLGAQDAVFAACSDAVAPPDPAPPASPLLLQQDRAYQRAAALLYLRKFDDAEQEFLAIAADRASPWNTTAGYVAARVLIRKSFAAVQDAQAPADFDPATMQAAGRYLHAYLASNPPEPWRQAAQKQLALVRIRLEPDARTRELGALLAGPNEDPNYRQDAKDMQWVLEARVPDDFRADAETWETYKAQDGSMQSRNLTLAEAEQHAAAKRDRAYAQTASLRALTPIVDWAITLRTLSKNNAPHAHAQWQQTHSLPWLVAGLMLAPDGAAPDPALMQAAASVPPSSPAWQTVTFHRARLQLAAGDPAGARQTIASLQSALDRLPATDQEPSTRNALRDLSLRAAATRPQLFATLSQSLLLASSEQFGSSTECAEVMTHRADWHHCIPPGTQQLDENAARFLNEQAPLSIWVEAAHSTAIAQPLHGAIAMQGWTRAVLLHDRAAAAALQPLLPQPLQTELSAQTSLTPWIVLVRNPGLQPFVDPGVQRAYSYDFVESFRLNWCYSPPAYLTPAFGSTAIRPDEASAGAAEYAKLQNLLAVDVGEKLMEAVQARPSDPAGPEALYLVLRMIRYGCSAVQEPGQPVWELRRVRSEEGKEQNTGEQLLQLRRATARLMRRYYANSPWTKKAAPFVGEVHPPPPQQTTPRR